MINLLQKLKSFVKKQEEIPVACFQIISRFNELTNKEEPVIKNRCPIRPENPIKGLIGWEETSVPFNAHDPPPHHINFPITVEKHHKGILLTFTHNTEESFSQSYSTCLLFDTKENVIKFIKEIDD